MTPQPDNAELKLLRETLLSIYREVAPEHSTGGEFLIRKLAAALFAAGGRISIGSPIRPPEVTIHQSLDPDRRIVWTDKVWNATLGYRSGAMVGHSVAEILTPDSYQFLREAVWPELLKTGKATYPTLTLVTRHGETLPARGTTEIMRDSDGAFLRTFSKLRTRIPLLVPALAAAALLIAAARGATQLELARHRHPQPVMVTPPQVRDDSAPVLRKGVFRRPKVLV